MQAFLTVEGTKIKLECQFSDKLEKDFHEISSNSFQNFTLF